MNEARLETACRPHDMPVPVPDRANPWLAIAGTWRDHPDIDQVVESVEAYRRDVDADGDRL